MVSNKGEEILEELKCELSEYFLGYHVPDSLEGLVGLAKHKNKTIIWISPSIFDNLSEDYNEMDICSIITSVTGWKFPNKWRFNADSKGTYWYHSFEGD